MRAGLRAARTRRLRVLMRVLAAAGIVALLAGCNYAGLAGDSGQIPQDALDPAGPIAELQDDLWNLVFPVAVAVFIIVQGGIIYLAVRFRDRGQDAPPKQVHGNTRLEVLWTIIPAVILVIIAVPTVRDTFVLAADPEGDPLHVRVVGKQYWWEFEYLDDEGQDVVTANELHIPTNRPVRLTMESRSSFLPDPGPGESAQGGAANGVIHSFWVPRLAGKQDVVAGHERQMTIQADEAGEYPGQCAEFCGLSHSRMRFVVIAQEADDFQSWLDQQAQPADTELDGLAAQGQNEVDEQGCLACHAISGHPADQGVRIGPDLTKFATRDTFAGAIFDTDSDEELRAWLADPPGVKAGAQMPNLDLSADEIDALTAYLRTLD